MTDTQEQSGIATAREAMVRFRRVSTLPEVALRIVERAGRADCDPLELAELFREDPALCVMLLKVANSPFYGLRHQVACVEHAAGLLGSRALRGVAIAASVGRLFRGADCFPGFSIRALWRHLVAVGGATRFLAKKFEAADPDEAFTAGLIHDLGLVVMMELDRARFEKLVTAATAPEAALWTEHEAILFGASHQEFGQAFAEILGLPDSMSEVSAAHHRPAEGGVLSLTVLVQVAHALVDEHDHGVLSSPPDDPATARALEVFRVDEARLAHLRERLQAELAEVQTLF